MIIAAARKAHTNAVPRTNPPAELLGLGPCSLGPAASNSSNGRPMSNFSFTEGPGLKAKKINANAYHVTWMAHHNQPRPGKVGEFDYSHRCHEGRCINPQHGVWEPRSLNVQRSKCKAAGSHVIVGGVVQRTLCPHEPVCVCVVE